MIRSTQVVIFDVDGCLATHTPGLKLDWENEPMCNDVMASNPPIMPMVLLARQLYYAQHHHVPPITVLAMTSRPERYRTITMDWLRRQDIKFHSLWMRANGDMRSDAEVKRSHLQTLRQNSHCEILFAIEDRASVVKMWRSEGVLCLQCAEGDY